MTHCPLQPLPIIKPSVILNARLPDREGLFYLCRNETGHLTDLGPMAEAPPDGLDVGGDWISPSGVDVQINGALGLAFPDVAIADADRMDAICQLLWEQGVDGFLPTIVTTSIDNIHRALGAIAQWMTPPRWGRATILGVHLEGPFLNPQKRGAHPAQHLRPLSAEQLQLVLDDYGSVVRVITLAPELATSPQLIPDLVSRGIIVSLGHSQASATQAKQVFERGASMVTHAFNAMPSLHHREPGLLGAALTHGGVWCGVIADGVHVCPTMLDVLLRIGRGGPRSFPDPAPPPAYPAGLFLVSDALSPLGLPDGDYPWDERTITVHEGTARLPDGTLSGTTLPLLTGAQNLVRWELCTPAEAIALATLAPRAALGQPPWPTDYPLPLLRWHDQPDAHTLTWQRLDVVSEGHGSGIQSP